MRNYFSKTLVAFIIAALIYFSFNSMVFIKDRMAQTAIVTITVLLCVILYYYDNSNFNRFGNQ